MLVCPVLSCSGDSIEASDPEKCCSFCTDDWVRAVGSTNVSVAYGQGATLTVEVLTDGVKRADKVWSMNGEKVKGATPNR